MLEVYNEGLRDLLAPEAPPPPPATSAFASPTRASAAGQQQRSLDVSAMGAGQLAAGQERVPGLSWRQVASVGDVLSVLTGGAAACCCCLGSSFKPLLPKPAMLLIS
jgi:hypothetical protein